jgi:predicted permease
MFESQIVLLKIGVMFLVMLAGWWASHRGYLDASISRTLGAFVVQVAFPALVFSQMVSTVSASGLRQGWWLPVFAGLALLLAGVIGHLVAGLFRIQPECRKTFIFLVGVPNWVFLPLPIAEALYGAEGVRLVLLFNVGAQVVLWTAAVRLLAGRTTGDAAWRGVLMNPGLMATLAGAGVALIWPEAANLGQNPTGSSRLLLAGMIDGGLKMLGGLTIPLSLLVTGAQLGELAKSGKMDVHSLSGVVVGRLLVAPFVTLVLVRTAAWLLGAPLSPAEFVTLAVILSMPVAISCTMFIERFGGDAGLSAAGIFYTTLLSLATVPLVVLICRVWAV